jgi:O-acetyl-ADP-ribose deacetylase (regulator of RNase III)
MENSPHPSFDPVLENPGTLYLSLLNLGADAAETIELIRNIAGRSPDPDTEITALFQGGWRLELIAGIAVLTGAATPATLKGLWQAIDRGSWVSPQLVVIASLLDPCFVDQAKRRLLVRCPIVQGERHTMDLMKAHVTHGPDDDRERSAKTFGALLQRLWQQPEEREWLKSRLSLADVMHEMFHDSSGQDFAREWARALATLRTAVTAPLDVDIHAMLNMWFTPEAIDKSGLPGEVIKSLLEHDNVMTPLRWLLSGRERARLELQGNGTLLIGKTLIPAPYGLRLHFRIGAIPPSRRATITISGERLTIERLPRITLTRVPLPEGGADMIAYGAKDTGGMGGGAAQAILKAAGEELQDALRKELARSSRKVGTVVVTRSFRLEQTGPFWIAHIVSIIRNTPQGAWCPEPERLADGVYRTLEEAERLGLIHVTFSALGTGEGRVPPLTTARIMSDSVMRYFRTVRDSLLSVKFSLPSDRDFDAFSRYLQ